ncbi:MAG TPA: glycosyltransferase family 2 protein [Flavobacterium sp.]|jgi:GT2 family glycosyltransferase|nr:glycosyltransferase family 2 protein [Flavobacterium sp.]
MQLSVIILNYNVRYFLEQCVLSVQKAIQEIDAEIIVVDNNSQDDSCAMIRQRFPGVRLIQNEHNLGYPKGNNIGVAVAKGEYICILNPDTVLAENTFTKILAFAENQKDLGIVGVRLIDGAGNFLPESKRGVPTPFVAFTKVTGLYKIFPKWFGKYYAQHLSDNQTGKVDVLVGAFMVMKKRLYQEVGGFDESCFMYSDDVDLSYMVLKSGRSNYYYADTTIIHYKGESTIKDHMYMRRFREAMNFFYKKHFRASAAFDVFMRIGAFFFALHKKKQSGNARREIDQYILLSDDDNFENEIKNFLGKRVTRSASATENDLNSLLADNTELIIDNGTFSFAEIIELMQRFRNKSASFKIRPAKNGFIIGSNSSNDRGEVIDFRILKPAISSEANQV